VADLDAYAAARELRDDQPPTVSQPSVLEQLLAELEEVA
jgi:hypothetical protein